LAVSAQNCDFKAYKAGDGLKAEMNAGILQLSWQGYSDQQLRAQFTIRNGQPTIHELAVRKGSANWIVLGRDLTPEFEVTSGVRRMSEQQAGPLRALKIQIK
jgi:hypothetical protein